MRLPHEMKEPGPLFRPWMVPLVGIGVLLLVLLFFATIPLDDAGLSYPERNLPVARFVPPFDGDFVGRPLLLLVDAGGTARPRDGEPLDKAAAEALVRHHRESANAGPVVALAHRLAPWDALRDLLEAVARAGQRFVHLGLACEGGGRGYLGLVVVGEAGTGEEVRITDVPLPDSVAVRRATEDAYARHLTGERPYRVVLRVEVPGNPTVQSIVAALECHASDFDDTVYLLAGDR